MRKILPVLLVIAAVLTLAACTAQTADGTTSATVTTPTTQIPTESTSQFTFEEITLADNENITFKIVASEEDAFGYTLKAYLENKTDLELMFSITGASVNGFMCDPFWAATVTAGMKSNEKIIFSDSSLDAIGADMVTEITFTLRIYDSNDFLADALLEQEFTIYPLGENAVSDYVRTPAEDEIVLFDNESCTMIVTGFDPDSIWGYSVNIYLENKTDKTLLFSVNDAAVNGFMCDPLWAEEVSPGKRSVSTVSWSDDDLASNGITNVESLTLPIRVYDSAGFMADELIDETFTVNP